jgi:putative aldouronate transport system permease protein
MLLPSLILLIIFAYLPMAGIVIGFQRFIPAKGLFGPQEWVGLYYFKYAFQLPEFRDALFNTLYISFMKIVAGIVTPVVFAILLNELRLALLKRSIQTIIYLPHFLSWVILAGVFVDILSPSYGIVNRLLQSFGIEPIFFLGSNAWFPYVLVATDTWKEFGFGTIVYLAAITSIDPNLYEAAIVDGANKWRQIWHITLPGMLPIIMLLTLLSIGSILNANFDQIFNLYSPQVYKSGDVLDTLVYRIGLLDANYSLSTAIGLFKSVVSCILISIFYYIAYRFLNYRIF